MGDVSHDDMMSALNTMGDGLNNQYGQTGSSLPGLPAKKEDNSWQTLLEMLFGQANGGQ